MSTYKYERYLSHVAQFPWAILPAKFAELVHLARFRAAGGRLTDEELQARFGLDAAASRNGSSSDSTIAVVPVLGTLAYRADSFEASSGGASAQRLAAQIDRLTQDERIGAILLDVDSPGGSVEGIPELAAKISAARKVKPVWAIANALAASAAYWIASQADKFYVLGSGQVGSIGVFMLTEDWSEHLEKEGIKINAISAGENKLEGAFWAPMSDETKAHFQAQVDAVYADFIRAVASGRGVSQATVKEQFGGGRVFDAQQALKRGMVDGIATFEEVAAQLSTKVRRSSRRATAADLTVTLHVDETKIAAAAAQIATEAEQFEQRANAIVEQAIAESVTTVTVEAETETPAIDPQLVADQDYIDAGIRIAERL